MRRCSSASSSRLFVAETITTERLILRRARVEDAHALHAIMSDPGAMRYWSTTQHQKLADTEAWLQSMIAAPADKSDDFIVELKPGPAEPGSRLIGKLGAWRLPEVGFLFAPAVWGRGYASEALAAFIVHRRRAGSLELTADTDPRNAGSIALLQRHGFIETGRAQRTWLVGDEWCDSIYWRLAL